MRPLSEQESAAQVRLLIDSALTIQSQGQSLNPNLMTELLMAAGGSAESFQSEDPDGIVASIRQAIEGYLRALSTLTPGMAILFAGVLTLIDRQDEFGGEARSDDSAVGSIPVTELTFRPRQLVFLFESALTLYSADALDACGRLLRLVLEQAPDHGAAHAASGMLAERQQDHEGVLRWYRSACRLMPDNSRIPLVLVNKLINLRRLDEAQASLDQVNATLCNQAEFWAVKASVAHEQHRLHEALECYARATALEASNIEYRHTIASIYLRLGDFDSANKILDRVLGRAVEQGDTEVDAQGAIGTFVQATIPIPFVTLRVRALALSGEVEAALQVAQELYDLIPEDFDAGICLAEQQIAHSEFDAATEVLDAIKPTERQQEIKKLLKQAELASTQYDPNTAIEYAKKATNLDPTDIDAQTALIGAQLMTVDVAAAQGTMRKVDQILKRHGREAARHKWRNSFHAGLVREFRTNPHAERKLTEILHLPSLQKIIAFAKLIEHEPGYLPASMALLIECRRHGVFDYDRPHPAHNHSLSETQSVPRTIVQFWDSPEIPSDIKRLMRSWDRCTDFEHRVFSDQSAIKFIEEHCTPRVLKAFRMANHPAMRADIFRLVFLSVSGGVYVDADDLCRHDIGKLLAPGFELILMQENLASIGNNFIAAAPRQPCIEFILSTIVDLVLEKQGNNVWFLTGPGALSSGFCRFYRKQLGRARLPAGVRVISVHQLYHFISPHIPCQHKTDERHWSSEQARSQSLFRRIASD